MWKNSANDKLDWQLMQWFTQTGGTGPNGDHTTGSGIDEFRNKANRKIPVITPLIPLPPFFLPPITPPPGYRPIYLKQKNSWILAILLNPVLVQAQNFENLRNINFINV